MKLERYDWTWRLNMTLERDALKWRLNLTFIAPNHFKGFATLLMTLKLLNSFHLQCFQTCFLSFFEQHKHTILMRFLSFITPDYLMIVIMIYLNCRRREKGIQLLIILGVRRHFDCCMLFLCCSDYWDVACGEREREREKMLVESKQIINHVPGK